MRLFLAVLLTVVALMLDPIVGQAFGDAALRPNLQLAPWVICISLCPGAPAVICCGILGLVLDCLAGPQLGARAACFSLLAALASMSVGRRMDSLLRRITEWSLLLFVAVLVSRITLGPAGVTVESRTVLSTALSAIATATLLGGLGLAFELLLRASSVRSARQFNPSIGRALGGD
jgi:rod shape-determining protein MreD